MIINVNNCPRDLSDISAKTAALVQDGRRHESNEGFEVTGDKASSYVSCPTSPPRSKHRSAMTPTTPQSKLLPARAAPASPSIPENKQFLASGHPKCDQSFDRLSCTPLSGGGFFQEVHNWVACPLGTLPTGLPGFGRPAVTCMTSQTAHIAQVEQHPANAAACCAHTLQTDARTEEGLCSRGGAVESGPVVVVPLWDGTKGDAMGGGAIVTPSNNLSPEDILEATALADVMAMFDDTSATTHLVNVPLDNDSVSGIPEPSGLPGPPGSVAVTGWARLNASSISKQLAQPDVLD